MHNFVVHLNESACRKSGRLRLEQVKYNYNNKKMKYPSTTILKHAIFLAKVNKSPWGVYKYDFM